MSKAINWKPTGYGGRVLKKQRGKCCYCARPVVVRPANKGPQPDDLATIDHLKPKSHGGERVIGNIAVACRACNSERGTMPWNIFKSMKMGETDALEAIGLGGEA